MVFAKVMLRLPLLLLLIVCTETSVPKFPGFSFPGKRDFPKFLTPGSREIPGNKKFLNFGFLKRF